MKRRRFASREMRSATSCDVPDWEPNKMVSDRDMKASSGLNLFDLLNIYIYIYCEFHPITKCVGIFAEYFGIAESL